MSTGPLNAITINTGNCPHGMPPGACPICSGKGGAGNSTRRVSNEMSWNECYAMGLMIKAQKQRVELNQQAFDKNLQQSLLIQKIASAFAEKIAQLKSIKLVQSITSAVSNSITTIKNIINKIAITTATLVNKAISTVRTIINQISEKFTQIKDQLINISDKLVAVFGELKQGAQKILQENISKLKKKLFSLFEMIDASLEQGDDSEEADYKRILSFKGFKKIKKTIRQLIKMNIKNKELIG